MAVDIEDRLHVVVAHRAQFRARRDGGQVAQHIDRRRDSGDGGGACAPVGCGAGGLLRRERTGDGQAIQRGQRVESVLRGLDGHVVADAAFGIEIEAGGGLEAAAEGHQQALRHILLRQADGLGAGAVHVHRHIGIVEGLLDARVGCAGNIADLIEHALGEGAVAVEVGADDLNIDGRREAEVENLGDDVHRQRVKSDAGILACQHVAQTLDIGRGGVVIFGELHLDVGVGRADGRGGRVGEIQSRVRQADVIDDGDHLIGGNLLADGVVDVVAEQGRLFNARAGAGAHVNLELAGVHGGEEVLPQRGRQKPHRTHGKDEEEDQKDRGVVHAQGKQPQVAVAQFLKAGLEGKLKPDKGIAAGALFGGLRVVVLLEQVLGHGGHQRCARAGSWPAWRRPRPRPWGQTGSAPRRSGRTWARRRCRWRGWRPGPGWRSARRRRGWPAPVSLPASRLRLMFSISTVASSTRMPTASASPPRVMMLMVSWSA